MMVALRDGQFDIDEKRAISILQVTYSFTRIFILGYFWKEIEKYETFIKIKTLHLVQ